MSRVLGSDAGATVLNQDIYERSATQKHRLGTRVRRGDRVFRYAKAGNSVYTGQAACHYQQVAVSYTTLAAVQPAGASIITIASQTFTKDQLQGGSVIIYGADNSDVQNRGIRGNDACSSSTLTVYLDGDLYAAVTASLGVEVLHNPYSDIRLPSDHYNSIAGLPAVPATTSYPYFWLQTWGPCWIAPGEAGVGGVSGERQLVFDCSVGALRPHNAALATTLQWQHAGYIINRDSSGNDGPPFVMLQINP